MALPPVVADRVLLGLGLGGFVDGIVVHQILRWHNMLTREGSYPKTTVAGARGEHAPAVTITGQVG